MPLSEPSPAQVRSFYQRLQVELSDPRDNRGKRHALAFVVCAVTLAMLVGRRKVSSLYRYLSHQIERLREVLGEPTARPVSRAHLPRLLAQVAWAEIEALVAEHFGGDSPRAGMDRAAAPETVGAAELSGDAAPIVVAAGWTAVDGKTLGGSVDATNSVGERILTAVEQTSHKTVAQAAFEGPKSSERAEAQAVLHRTGLEHARVSLDALHLIPVTPTQIHKAHGRYVIQVKANQKVLWTHLVELAATTPPSAEETTATKGHGRVNVRTVALFPVEVAALAPRWWASGFCTLVRVHRKVTYPTQQKTTHQTAYYLSNEPIGSVAWDTLQDLAGAVRGHWGVEVENWIRDVTLGEDGVKTKDGKLTKVLASLRTVALQILRRLGVQNFQAALELFMDCPQQLLARLRQAQFL